jgi:hypothetical protein
MSKDSGVERHNMACPYQNNVQLQNGFIIKVLFIGFNKRKFSLNKGYMQRNVHKFKKHFLKLLKYNS